MHKIGCLFGKSSFSSNAFDSTIDKTAVLRQNVRFYGSSLGRYSYICRDSLIQHTNIGSFCSISEGCVIGLPSHPTTFLSSSPVFLSGGNYLKKHFANAPYDDCETTCIGSDVWIGCNVLVKSGVSIGDGAVIGAGSIVTKDIPAFSIAVGVPAKVIGMRFEDEVVELIKKIAWWNWPDERLVENGALFTGEIREPIE
ncbi:CatB-related O-acetyltransferase [Adlercreutzia sp. ZJ305]|nr:CatB-related O-acetyltransferase [Adlercreutzia sp. ZJ305]